MAVEQLGGLTALGAVLSPLDGAGPRTDAVVARISAAIAMGVMSDGEQLPSEIELATQLGVSTMTLREALAVLRQQGLVETKRGRGGGSFVRASADAVNSRSLARLHDLTMQDLRDLGDEHFAIAGASAVLAARRGVAGDVARLKSLAQRLVDAEDPVRGRRADSRFQIEVAVCAQSARLTRAEVNLQAEISALKWLPQMATDAKVEGEQHLALVAAIAAEDEAAARGLAEAHSAATVRRVIELRMELTQ
ncbi:GntR family transcriptional regulator [Mycobacterium sp. 21AC1]|uniref:FadR/GntR family transcriptional regulator n=1 Tax=[Mycobacterium] appelbergii TaxID=2939269 RepID=UPI002938D294|nr:GntR family transcriptional regulator [Mycobacterium sp. 21AC1]MDV3130069.1 GntR family transcriptional regulator [Mycobacterium sp. 21AC1]